MKLDCFCGGWSPRDRRRDTIELNRLNAAGYPTQDDRPIAWTCILCGRRVCTACEGTVCGVAAVDNVCDECWAGVCALLGVAVARALARRLQ